MDARAIDRRLISKFRVRLAGLIIVSILGVAAWLLVAPPELLRVANAYAAKIVCSNALVAHRDIETVLAEDVQAPGNPALNYANVEVHGNEFVSVSSIGVLAYAQAVHNKYTSGCTLTPGRNFERKTIEASPSSRISSELPSPYKPWPEGSKVETDPSPALTKILSDPALTGPGMRAVVVVKEGKIIGETYGKGFTADTPLLGWSMTKTVNAAILGRAYAEGKLKLTDDHLRPEWTDDRAKITITDLLAMKSGLEFNEDYDHISDVSRMLFLESDMAKFAASKPLEFKPGTHFNYSTGTSILLSRIWQDRVGDEAWAYPRIALFNPLRMSSAVFETDEAGTFVGGSYIYATARDWARFGLLLEQDGIWDGNRLLPEDFMTMMRTSNGSTDGYSQAQTWLADPGEDHIGQAGLPKDTFWMVGHDGQSVAIIPSQRLVVVRLGLTPQPDWDELAMLKAIVAELQGGATL